MAYEQKMKKFKVAGQIFTAKKICLIVFPNGEEEQLKKVI
jgi:hypothetical protein